jgi:hypothetical protein
MKIGKKSGWWTAVLLAAAGACLFSFQASAFNQETHRRIVLDAVAFMRANPDTTNYRKLEAGVTRAGYTVDEFADVIAQAARDVDSFADTYICGAITGSCERAPLWGLGSSIARYTAFWHFEDHAHGTDVHGNPYGGYNAARVALIGDVDELAAAWLWNDYLDDGSGGMSGLLGDGTQYDSFHRTEAHYRLQTASTPAMYADFQTTAFQPISNLGQYWFTQFLARPTAQTLGFALHTTDLLVPHHTWNTLGNYHSGFENWIEYYYDAEQLNDGSLVRLALQDFAPLRADEQDIRNLLHRAGDYSYENGLIALVSQDHAQRLAVARKVVPHATALVVLLLNRAAERIAP